MTSKSQQLEAGMPWYAQHLGSGSAQIMDKDSGMVLNCTSKDADLIIASLKERDELSQALQVTTDALNRLASTCNYSDVTAFKTGGYAHKAMVVGNDMLERVVS